MRCGPATGGLRAVAAVQSNTDEEHPMTTTPASPTEEDVPVPSHLPFPVIGIGASAGGLEAVQRFLAHVPADCGMAFVVILHLSPRHRSNAAEILQRATPMDVSQVTAPVPIRAGHVYVIPPGMALTMDDGHLRPVADERPRGRQVAVDVYFRTMAEVHRERAICIVMSGTGSDGALGLQRVKEHGGITLAQRPEEAEHDGMPLAAIATGRVDLVLPVAEMGRRLVALWSDAKRIHLPDDAPAPPPGEAAGGNDAARDEAALQQIMGLLRSFTRHDFKHYKRATVLRRIERRMQVNQVHDLPAYHRFLESHPEEAVPLLQDMLISVTNFFRDRDAFDALEREVVPTLIAQKSAGDPLRVWVAGCATGEEAYSVGILLKEYADLQAKALDVQIFATDIDERAIATARKGVYPEGIVEYIAPGRLRQFFVQDHDQFRISNAVREPILFAAHNLLRDPPFSRLDLITCRNLLIYLDREAQQYVLEVFRLALQPNGYLFLGTSESSDAVGNLFVAVDKKHRIFRVNPDFPTRRSLPLVTDLSLDGFAGTARAGQAVARRSERRGFAEVHQRAVEQYAPPSVLVDRHHNICHMSKGVGRFMERLQGEPSDNLLSNVRDDIRLELRTALFKAAQSERSVETRLLQREVDGRQFHLNIIVRPVRPEPGTGPLTLVVFDEVEESIRPHEGGPPDPARAQLIGQLEHEIKQMKVHLQETIETAETSTEELKASNEELQAINEELRSATEELETSKEELQSMNEELVTVNFELKVKVEERGHINDDLQNLITSSEIATIFVDRGMRIKRYTPQASKLFALIPTDHGRSLFDITSRLNYPELADDAASTFKDLRVSERHVSGMDGSRYLARILPYRTADDKIEGAIINFFDVTKLRDAQQLAEANEERLRLVAATTRDFIIITTDEDGIVTTWNAGAVSAFGHGEAEMVGQPIATIFTPEDRAASVPERELRDAATRGRAEDERWHLRKDGGRIYCSGVMTPIALDGHKGFAKIARDMTEGKQAELAQEQQLSREKKANLTAQTANELKDKFLAVMSHELKQPLNLIQMNVELLTRLPLATREPRVMAIGETIKRAVGSQTRIINDLLDLSRIRTGKLRLNRVTLDLGELVESLAQAADVRAKHQTLTLACEPGILCMGDRTRIEQIVWNLLSNAMKFTPEGGAIAVGVAREERAARVTIEDDGCGIAPEFLSHVFGMFNQVEVGAMPANGGLGIGLALVHELTRAHGGRVQAHSEGLGKGARFTVWLPLRTASGPVGEVAPVRAIAQSFSGLRLLVVDDYIDGLLPLAEVLRLEGALVDVAANGKEALSALESKSYDLLISDLGMPEMDGYELIREIRRRTSTAELYAIAMSGFGRRTDARKAFDAGFDAHVPKPATIEELRSAMARSRV